MWILILTIFYAGHSAETESVYFENEKACQSAGELWAQENGKAVRDVKFICVKAG